ncbi:MAG: hypothetical protein ACXWPM_06475 [Bdellovibrionota bacterium]
MDPKVMMEMSNLIRELPPERLSKLQSIMHNMQAGFDVRAEMEEFERSLPENFRQKLFTLMSGQMAAKTEAPMREVEQPASGVASTSEMDVREARMTVLRAVARGELPPEDAEKLLFPT